MSTVEPTDDQIRAAYIYLLGRILVIRQEHADRGADGFAYNQIRYNPLGSADFVNPNFDVAYLEAWFAVDDDTAVLLEVPEIKGRYYTAQILDEWGEVIANINERTTPTQASGTFALVKPGATPALPGGATRIDLHSSKAKMLARVELADDTDGALAIQRRFTTTTIGTPIIAAPPSIPMFDNASLLGVEIFDDIDTVLASALDVSPAAAPMQVLARAVADHAASSPAARAEVDRLITDTVVPEFKQFALTHSGPYVNNWVGGAQTGSYGSDYVTRTVVNLLGIWANTPAEVVYYNATHDGDGQPLTGAGSYVVHFPADGLPSSIVDSYWSIILVSVPDFRVIANPLDRYNLNSYSELALEPDGSLKITIWSSPIDGIADTNRLPSAPDKAFALTFRAYVPKPGIDGGGWAPPPVTRLR